MLQVGPEAVRPRYPPGFPLLLAGALRAGLSPERLSAVTALADAGLAFLVALGAGGLVIGAAGILGGRPAALAPAAALAAGTAGAVVALASWHVRHGKLLHSDAPVALAATLAALAWLALFRRGGPAGRAARIALAAGAGLLFGWVATARPIEAALLAPVLAAAPFALGERRPARIACAVAVAALAAALPVAAAAALLVRSGEPPLAWSAYGLWLPQHYGERADWLGWRWVVGPSPVAFGERAGWPGWRTALSTATGLPPAELAPGPVWPLAGWLVLGALLVALVRRRGEPRARELTALLALGGLWALGHLLFFPFYFYPSRRFYLVAAHLATLLAAAGVGLLLTRRRAAAAAGLALALAILATTIAGWRQEAARPGHPRAVRPGLERRFERWLARPAERRARGAFPLDPVQAQAFGWLDRERSAAIGAGGWGELPATTHVRRLRRGGSPRDRSPVPPPE